MGGFLFFQIPALDCVCVNFIYLLFLSRLDTQRDIWTRFS